MLSPKRAKHLHASHRFLSLYHHPAKNGYYKTRSGLSMKISFLVDLTAEVYFFIFLNTRCERLRVDRLRKLYPDA